MLAPTKLDELSNRLCNKLLLAAEIHPAFLDGICDVADTLHDACGKCIAHLAGAIQINARFAHARHQPHSTRQVEPHQVDEAKPSYLLEAIDQAPIQRRLSHR